MPGLAVRLTKVLLLAGLALAVTATSGSAASATKAPLLGVVPHTSQQAPGVRALAEHAAVSRPGFLTFDSSYETTIDRYFADVAHDSGGSSNVYSAATQYSDGSGSVQYRSAFGGSFVDHDPLPANGCSDGKDSACVSKTQLQAEIQRVLTLQGWHGSSSNLFFVMTPDGVGSCVGSNTQCSTNYFCAYHDDFTDSSGEQVLFANEPYQAAIAGCESGSAPNGGDADTTINTISHEHNEAITDPLGNAWWSNDGSEDENGDLCAWTFGATLGGNTLAPYNQVINGHHYWLQQEWSNADNGCVQHLGGPATAAQGGSGPLVDHGGPVMHTNTTYAIYWLPRPGNRTLPTVSGTAAAGRTLTSSKGAWNGSPTGYAYQWQRCSAKGSACVDISGATDAQYKLTRADASKYVRSTVRAENVNGSSAFAASGGELVTLTPHAATAPRIAGVARIGRRLTASKGSWSGPPSKFSFQWLRCNAAGGSCVAIGGATHSAYKLTTRDASHRLRVRVTAANAAGRMTATSRATSRVSAAKH
ncbi:MAG TPA: hypothetical protein VKB43_11180 [Gaiellaceae bacterium]|nr:hypothetical protein [Gaiellaceae bacterium]